MDPGSKPRVNDDSTKQQSTVQPLKLMIKLYIMLLKEAQKKWL